MTPRRTLSVVYCLWSVVCSLSLASSPDLSWDVETSRLASQPIEIRRGETVTLTPRFLLHSAVLPLTNSETCVLYYRSTDMTTGLYYAITGAVHNATNGQARVTWTAANCPTATNLQADFVVASSNVINLRAYANITLRDSVFAQASTVTNPPTVTAADLSVLTGQVAGTLINAPDLAWDVESSALSVKPLQIRRGETVTLTPRFLLNSAVVSFTNTAQAALYYRASNMTTGHFYAAGGVLHNATNGQARVNWTSANCPTSATNLQGEIIVLYPGVTNLRAAVSITLQDSVFGTALTASDPQDWRLIDWASTTNLNVDSAPFAVSSSCISASTATSIVHTIVDPAFAAVTQAINSATGELAVVAHTGAYGDLSGKPSIPSTNGLDTVVARAAAVAAATQTIAGASVSGAVGSATTAGTAGYATTAGSASAAEEADYFLGDTGLEFMYATIWGVYLLDYENTTTAWIAKWYERELFGTWSVSNLTFRAGATVTGMPNVPYAASAGTATNALQLGGVAASVWSNKVFATVTNQYYGGWYSIGNSVTSLLARAEDAQIITQIVSWAEFPGVCTSYFFTTTYWSNRVTGASSQIGVPHSSTGSLVNCYLALPANGGLWQVSCVNARSSTNVTFGVRGVQ